ncbi:hypothetical protein ARALYDRAFT_480521 [Arabidopsis lyrata subsp. lyrata]|uniref:LOB domain-containing protein n=1 Tax=Arabidopsis lyrata subsp. lyrata TaxID=81972 RepID=D7L6Z6_ARALL|nr:hypothetical protein ARALYDRAFT_480521 [Arabidopsis lyrata subsp. lyrata]
MEPLGNHRPYSVCITRNKNCPQNCEYAKYFPYKFQYESANELFGTPNIIKMMRHVPEEKKQILATSIIMEGNAWTKDPIYKWWIRCDAKAHLEDYEEKKKTELHLLINDTL